MLGCKLKFAIKNYFTTYILFTYLVVNLKFMTVKLKTAIDLTV